MSTAAVALFLLATFIGGVTSGLAGFALGLVVSGVFLHIMTPLESATLIVGYSLVSQGYGIWQLQHAFAWRAVAPYVIGGLFGAPLGTALLTYVSPGAMRVGLGLVLLVLLILAIMHRL
jgi:hypothetical protein